jgi:hypothetical protein
VINKIRCSGISGQKAFIFTSEGNENSCPDCIVTGLDLLNVFLLSL